MRRIALAGLALTLASCGQPVETAAPDSASDDPPASTVATPASTTTTTATSATTTATVAPTTTQASAADTTTSTTVAIEPEAAHPLVEGLASELGFAPGVAIERPTDFPTLDELSDTWFLSAPHPRARISSWMLFLDAGAVTAGDYDPEGQGGRIGITYHDEITIWDYDGGDYDGGYREVATAEGGLLIQAEDGTWVESDSFEWPPIGPIPEWFMLSLDLEPTDDIIIVGYELIADTPTMRLRFVGTDRVGEYWIDEIGATFRMVAGSLVEDEQWWLLVWDVETLSPELTGPLPPGL